MARAKVRRGQYRLYKHHGRGKDAWKQSAVSIQHSAKLDV